MKVRITMKKNFLIIMIMLPLIALFSLFTINQDTPAILLLVFTLLINQLLIFPNLRAMHDNDKYTLFYVYLSLLIIFAVSYYLIDLL